MKIVFVRVCDAFGGATDPRGHLLVQVDEQTYRIATGKDLDAVEVAYPGLINSLPHDLPDDED